MDERNSNDESPGNRVQMSGATFDTLKFVETLEQAGIPTNHAKAISNAVRDARGTAELATKTDLREAVSEVRAEIQALRGDTRAETQTLRGEAQTLRGEMRAEMQELRSEMRADMQKLRGETRSDLQTLEAGLRSDIQRLDSRIDRLELQLTVRLGAIILAAFGALTVLLKWVA